MRPAKVGACQLNAPTGQGHCRLAEVKVARFTSKVAIAALHCCVVSAMAAFEAPGAEAMPAAILQELRSFHEMGSVLHIAAHPDDENTQLIT